MNYSIWDPTGNITALVETRVETARQPEAAASILQRHPEVEQVGFVRDSSPGQDMDVQTGCAAFLRMAGGEFCGNASMSTAAWYVMRRSARNKTESGTDRTCGSTDETLFLKVSGAKQPVEVRLQRTPGSPDTFRGSILMPEVLSIGEESFAFGGETDRLPVVRMEGISHIIIGEDSLFSGLLKKPAAAGEAVKAWCRELRAEGLGLMFLAAGDLAYRLTPLVYVPGSGTVFWEHSCASGTCAAGAYLAEKKGKAGRLRFEEPGGFLETETSAGSRRVRLSGSTRLLADFREPMQ